METKKDRAIKLSQEGKSAREIAKILDMHSNNVYTILTKYRLEKKLKVYENK